MFGVQPPIVTGLNKQQPQELFQLYKLQPFGGYEYVLVADSQEFTFEKFLEGLEVSEFVQMVQVLTGGIF